MTSTQPRPKLTHRFSVLLSPQMFNRISDDAERQDVTRAKIVRRILTEHYRREDERR